MAETILKLKIPKKLAKRYNKLAKGTGHSKSQLLREALAESIDRLEFEYRILKKVEDFRADRLKTYSLEEMRKRCGLDEE